MNFILDQVMKLQDVHNAYGHFAVESLAGSAVMKSNLACYR